MDDLKERRGYSHLKEEALDRTMWRARFGWLSILFIFHYIFLRLAKPSQFIPLQNVVYFILLAFLVRKIFTFYINDVPLFKCPFPGPKG